jgi:hypothetical protein
VGKTHYLLSLLQLQLLLLLLQDKELQALLAGQYVDIGLPPGKSSAAYQLLVMQHYLVALRITTLCYNNKI